MSEFWNGVFTGLATSGIVAAIVYLVQKRDSDRGVSRLSTEIGTTADIAREALRTTIEIQSGMTEFHQAIRAGQSAAARNSSRETLRPEHVTLVENFLEGANISSLTRLHALLVGAEIVYAGALRDVNVSVSGHERADLVPLPADQIPRATHTWLTELGSVLKKPPTSSAERMQKIIELHIELLRIHPFFDGNGLLGRALVAALSKRLLGGSCVLPREDPNYFTAIRAALAGDKAPLTRYFETRLEA